MEIEVEGVSLKLPEGLCDDYNTFLDIISPDTWNNHLTDENRESLMKFLPDFHENDLEEKTRTLERFFMQENFKFGTPIESFFNKLRMGEFQPAIGKMKKMHRKLQYKSYKLRQKEYCHDLLEDVLVSRQHHLEKFSCNNNLVNKMPERIGANEDATSTRVRRRYLKELKQVRSEAGLDSDLSDDDISSEGVALSLNKKQRRQLFMMEASYPADLVPVRGTFSQGSLPLDLELRLAPSRNPFDCSDEQYRNLLLSHFASKKAKKSAASLDTRGITVQSVMQRTDIHPVKRPPPRSDTNGVLPQGNKPLLIKKENNKRQQMKTASHTSRTEPNGSLQEEASSYTFSSESDNVDSSVADPRPRGHVKSKRTPSNCKKRKRKEKTKKITDEFPVKIKEEKDIKIEDFSQSEDVNLDLALSAELTQETHISFFSLLRDVVCSTPLQRMSRAQLDATVRTWLESAISPLNDWFSLCPSWHFVLPCAVNFLCGNVHNDIYPSDFVPYIEYKLTGKVYQWIGAGRDSDANLESLCQFWLINRDHMSNDWTTNTGGSLVETADVKVLPSPKATTTFTVRPPSDADRKAYHVQESQRYERPHKAFTFRMHGYESVIGPVKGIYEEKSGTTSKARGHSLLVDDRPHFVTILSLVRDAVARQPNGEGTKADICELLSESQFIVSAQGPNHDSTLNSVASGALDRLQYGEDPCVKFDTARKSWVYLHRDRTEEEFERMHHLNGPTGGKTKHHGSSRKSSKLKKEEAHPPPNVSLEPFASSIRQMDGTEVKVKAEDKLENWVKLAGEKPNMKASEKSARKPFKADVKENSQDIAIGSNNSGTTLPSLTSAKVYKKGDATSDSIDLSRSQLGLSPAAKGHASVASVPVIAMQQGDSSAVIGKRKLLRPIGMTLAKSTSTTDTPNTAAREGMAKVTGIEVLQYPSISSSQGKTTISGSPIVVQAGGSALQTLVGQKIILPSNRVLLQGGKVLHTIPAGGILGGNKVLTGVFPPHLMAVSGLKSGTEQTSEGNLPGGRYVQIACVDSPGSFQKVALVPQVGQVRSTGSSKAHLALQAAPTPKKSGTEVRLKMAAGSNQLASTAGSLISLGGKQIILTSKHGGAFTSPQLQRIMLADANSSDASADSVKTMAVGQPIVLPASALQGSQINLKRLQTYQSFKVIPASQLTPQQKGKPIGTLVSTSTTQGSTTTKTSFPIKPNISDANDKK